MFTVKNVVAAATLLAAASVHAQGPQIPTCAQPCVRDLLGGGGDSGCNGQDGKCICTNTQLISNLSCCVFKACPEEDQQNTVNFARNICGAFGVSGTIPDQASCPSSSAPAPSPTPTVNISTMLAPGPVILTQPAPGYTSPSTLVIPSAYGTTVSINTDEYISQASTNSADASRSAASASASASPTGSGSVSESGSNAAAGTPTSSAAPEQSTGAAVRNDFGAAGAFVAAVGGLAAML